MLLIYDKLTGEIVGINTSPIATFENMFPDATEEFKQKYGGIVVDYNPDYDKNRDWYKVENGKVVKLDSPFIKEDKRPKIPDPKDKEIADLKNQIADLEKMVADTKSAMLDSEMAIAAILGGAV